MALIKCSECGKEISDKAKTCPNCGAPVVMKATLTQNNVAPPPMVKNNMPEKKKGSCLKSVGIFFAVIIVLGVIGNILGGEKDDKPQETQPIIETEESVEESAVETEEVIEESPVEEKEKYCVGDTWQNDYIKITYTNCYEFTDYNQYNAPASGNKIVCAEFEFENIGNSDETVMYTDFNGYADGYEVNQSYAPDGTGINFSVKMSAGRKGNGIVAFEVPENAEQIEIEFSPNFWTSENVIFVYQ